MNSQVQFINSWVLYFLWFVPLIAWWWHASAKKTESRLSAFMSPEMQKKLRPASSQARQAWQTALVAIGIFLVLVAAARPQWGTKEEKVYQRGRDLVIALDVSRSMLANDVHPNRLQRAKIDILDLVKEMHGDRAALLAFRKRAVMLCPLTTDYAYFRQALDAVSIDSAPSGETDIGDAIKKAIDALKRDERSHKAIILISDGEDLSGKALVVAEEAGKLNIPIFTVGLGSSSGSKIPSEERNRAFITYKNEDVVTRLNDGTMHAIAKSTKGAYIPVGTASMTSTTLGMLYRDHLSRLAALDQEETIQRRAVERYQMFLFPAFLLMLAAAFLSRGRLATSSTSALPALSNPPLKDITEPARPLKNISAVILATLPFWTSPGFSQTTNEALPIGSSAAPGETVEAVVSPNPDGSTTNVHRSLDIPPGREGARVAQKYYLAGRYAEAADAYMEALRGAPENAQQDFRYNAAISLYNAKKYAEAADILKDLFHNGKADQNNIATGLGAALFRAAEVAPDANAAQLGLRATRLRESGEAFKEITRSIPGDKQSRKNLAVVLQALPTAQENARTAELMSKYEQTPAQSIAEEMLKDQRQIVADIPAAFTNDSPSQISMLEAISGKQKSNADLWIPLKGKLLASMAQAQNKDPKIQQQVAAFEQLVEATRTYMKSASAAIRDLDTSGYNLAAQSEHSIYQFWKSIASYGGILNEDIRRQTNSMNILSSETTPDQSSLQSAKIEQDEALNLTELFSKRFAESVPESGEPQKPVADDKEKKKTVEGQKDDEEKQGISAETRRKILELAGQAISSQKTASSLLEKQNFTSVNTEQKKACEILKEIEKLLPKDKSQSQQQQKDQQKQEDKQQQKQDNQQQDQKQQDKKDQQQPEQQSEEKQEQKAEDENKKNGEKEEISAEQLKRLLEKAAQRENEHEARKREKNRSIPLSPIDRDW